MAHSKEYMRNYINKWRKKRREYAFNKLGGKCRECGSTDKLEFDHIDHNSKILNIARMWTASKIKFDAELAKCQLLCMDCHLIKKYNEGSLIKNRMNGEQNPNSKLNNNNILQIKNLLDDGISLRVLGKQFNVHHTLISKIKNNKLWKNVC